MRMDGCLTEMILLTVDKTLFQEFTNLKFPVLHLIIIVGCFMYCNVMVNQFELSCGQRQ